MKLRCCWKETAPRHEIWTSNDIVTSTYNVRYHIHYHNPDMQCHTHIFTNVTVSMGASHSGVSVYISDIETSR